MVHQGVGPKVMVAAMILVGAACGQWRRVGSDQTPTPDAVLPGLFELSSAYHRMGFLSHGSPVAFVAAVRYLAGPTPDSTLGLFSASMSNSALSFRRASSGFEASYRVEARFLAPGGQRSIVSTETVRVPGFQETQRADESIIFQQSIWLPPGAGTIEVKVNDLNTGGYSRDSAALVVPRFPGPRPTLSSIVPFYEGPGRRNLADVPAFLLNPRGTVPFGSDTLRLYVEGYGVDTGSAVQFRALDETGTEVWRAVGELRGTEAFTASVVRAEPGALPVGELRVEAMLATGDTVRAPVLVSFSDLWVVANLDDVIRLLRYFGYDERLRALRAASPAERPALWREFWRETDPNSLTPENEAMAQYFARVQVANERYREGSDAGWLTDRGEVYINLGDPDVVFDQSSELQVSRGTIRWTFNTERLVLDFVDDSGFGRFRLTPASRAEYLRVLARLRRSQ